MRITPWTALLLLIAVCPSRAEVFVVAQNGGGQFETLQQAISAVRDESRERTIILVKPGKYRGPLLVPESKANVTLRGESAENTILTYGQSYEDLKYEQTHNRYRGCTAAVLGNGFRAEKIAFENTAYNRGRATALRVDGDRAVFVECRIASWQGALMVEDNRQYFRDCRIEGRLDFVCGSATAVFDRCEIRSRRGGCVALASTPRERQFGFVFLNCSLVGDGEPAYLGRPWSPYASITYIECEMGAHIKTAGWHNRDRAEWEVTVRFGEYNSRGAGANAGFGRVAWSRQLLREEAETMTAGSVLAGADGWAPGAEGR